MSGAHFKLNREGRVGRCRSTGKVQYVTRKFAKKGLKRTALLMAEGVSEWNTYPCRSCSYYHIGHAPGVKWLWIGLGGSGPCGLSDRSSCCSSSSHCLPVTKACKDCGSTTKKLGYPGPRCLGCHRVFKLQSKRRQLDAYYRKTYNLSLEDYEALYDFQGGKCWVCQWATGASKRLAVDHDHDCCPTTPTCGQCTRGLICSQDNKLFGRAKDNPEFFRRGMEYLTYPPAKRWKEMRDNA